MFGDNSKVRTLAALCELNAIKSLVHSNMSLKSRYKPFSFKHVGPVGGN